MGKISRGQRFVGFHNEEGRWSQARTDHEAGQYQAKMSRYLLGIAGSCDLHRFPGDGKLSRLALNHFLDVLNLYDSFARYTLGRMRQKGHSVTCAIKCTHCCHQMPASVSAMEMITIYNAMHQSHFLSKFLRRSLGSEELWVIAAGACACEDQDIPIEQDVRERTLRFFQRMNHPCPFLEDGLCEIYPVRPLACRMHFSLSPSHWCGTGHFQNPYSVPINIEPGEKVWNGLDRLDRCLGMNLSDLLICGLLDLTVNVMRFREIQFI